jgi:predicted secreted hydrolase
MSATGELQLDGERLRVGGIAWFDHQWGDFVAVGGGGWDWFAINLDDGRDITLSTIRNEHGEEILGYGTVVDVDGSTRHLAAVGDFTIGEGREWLSPVTGRSYPVAWSILLEPSTVIGLTPTVVSQELDTRATTGVAYWEGSHRVQVLQIADGEELQTGIGGEAYVEVTRYGVPQD